MFASAAQSLPSDVICEFFGYFSTPLLVRIDGRAPEFPWYLGHICSSWRVAFLSMRQEFWSKFMLNSTSPETEQRCTALAEVFLERNQGLPFSFDIHRHARSRLILDGFIKESTRWLDASFAVDESDIPSLVTIKNNLPHLRSLHLTTESLGARNKWRRSKSTTIPEYCRDIFKDAPHLTHVKLVDLSTWQFPWASLVSLEFTEQVPNLELLGVLPQMVNLEKLVVQKVDVGDKSTPITLPHLKVLILLEFTLLKVLAAPALEQLTIEDWGSMSESVIWPSFIHRSSCQLQILGLAECSVTDLAHALRYTPELKFLAIYSGSRLETIFELLTYSPNKPPLVPELQSLRIVFPNLCEWNKSHPALNGFLDSRTINRPSFIHRMQEIILVSSYTKGHLHEEMQEQCILRDIRLTFEGPSSPGWVYRLCGYDDDLVQYFRSALIA